MAGGRDERVIDLFFLEAPSAPTEEGLIRRYNNDLVAYINGQEKSLTAGSGGGEANTASNVGGEAEVFKQKTGVDLEFRTLEANGGIDIEQKTDTVEISTGFRRHFLLMGA